jgi:hypothetical protein
MLNKLLSCKNYSVQKNDKNMLLETFVERYEHSTFEELFLKTVNILPSLFNDKELKNNYLIFLSHKISKDSVFQKDLELFLNNLNYANLNFNSKLKTENLPYNKTEIIKELFFQNPTFLSLLFNAIKENNQLFLKNNLVENIKKILFHLQTKENPELINSLLECLAEIDKVQYSEIILDFFKHYSSTVQNKIIEIYSKPESKVIDLLIDYLVNNISLSAHQGIYSILETVDKDPLTTLYKRMSMTSPNYWRAINILVNLNNKKNSYKRDLKLDNYSWSENFFQELYAPRIKDEDVQNLFKSLKKEYQGFDSLSVLRQVRYKSESDERAIYVVSFLHSNSRISENAKNLDVIFAKQINDSIPQNEVEGTNILKAFGIRKIPEIKILSYENSSFFVRKFLDGFTLDEITFFKEKALKYFDNIDVLLKDFAYQLGKIAVQSDLIRKGDCGGKNELIVISGKEGNYELQIMQIDLSSSFSVDSTELGLLQRPYLQQLKTLLKISDVFTLTYSETRELLDEFFIGIEEQYSSFYGKVMFERIPNNLTYREKSFYEETKIRLQNTQFNIINNIRNTIGPFLDKDPSPKNKDNIIIASLFNKHISSLAKIRTIKRKNLNFPDFNKYREKFENVIKNINNKSPESIFFSLRDFYLDFKAELNLEWKFNETPFEHSRVEFLAKLSENFSEEGVEKFLGYMKKNIKEILLLKDFDFFDIFIFLSK